MTSPSMTGFIDTHSHFLPGLDDGPENYEQCLVAAREYLAIGVERVIATPHWIQGTGWAPAPALVRARAAEAEERIRAAGMDLRILPGMEIALTDFLCGHFVPADFVAPSDHLFFLVEFPLFSALSAPTPKGIRTLLARGADSRFIIAHPERCALFQDNLDRVRELVAAGMLTQVNISSILGWSGNKARDAAVALFADGLVHLLGTDSHARPGRMPPGPLAMAELEKLIGADNVALGFRDNPEHLLRGEEPPPCSAE